jgi:ureidoglycolate hydrolase
MPHRLITLTPTRLTEDAFAPYGRTVSLGSYSTVSPDNLFAYSTLDLALDGPIVKLAIIEGRPGVKRVHMVERHHAVAQTFIPLGPLDCLFVVAAPTPDSAPRAESFHCFRWLGDCVVALHPGSWHTLGSPAATSTAARFAMLTGVETDRELRAFDASGVAPHLTDIVDLAQAQGVRFELADS